jgi:hypothetical protein
MKVTEKVRIISGKGQRQDAEGCTIGGLGVKFTIDRNLPVKACPISG